MVQCLNTHTVILPLCLTAIVLNSAVAHIVSTSALFQQCHIIAFAHYVMIPCLSAQAAIRHFISPPLARNSAVLTQVSIQSLTFLGISALTYCGHSVHFWLCILCLSCTMYFEVLVQEAVQVPLLTMYFTADKYNGTKNHPRNPAGLWKWRLAVTTFASAYQSKLHYHLLNLAAQGHLYYPLAIIYLYDLSLSLVTRQYQHVTKTRWHEFADETEEDSDATEVPESPEGKKRTTVEQALEFIAVQLERLNSSIERLVDTMTAIRKEYIVSRRALGSSLLALATTLSH